MYEGEAHDDTDGAVDMSDPGADPTATIDATDRLRRAALDQFARVGFGSATVELIAEDANVGIASLYRRWDDKAALANALFADFLSELTEVVTAAWDSSESATTAEDRFMVLWVCLWDFALADPARFLFIETHTSASFISPENLERKAAVATMSAEIFDALGLTLDPMVASGVLTGSIVGILQLGAEPDPDELGRRMWAALSASV